jgi:hypothetical protein
MTSTKYAVQRGQRPLLATLALVLTLVGVLALASAARADVSPGETSDAGVAPVLVAGNPTCDELGYANGFKATEGGSDWQSGSDDSWGPSSETGNYTFGLDSTDGVHVDWTSTPDFAGAVVVKGANGADSYVYQEARSGDKGLTPPVNSSGEPAAISHVQFCWEDNASPQAKPLTVEKTAQPSLDRTDKWTITKNVDKTRVEQVGGTATFNYTVNFSAADPAYVDDNWQVTGQITVTNPNDAAVTGVDVTDAVGNHACAVTGGTDVTVPANNGTAVLDYTCSFGSAPTTGTNTATASWHTQTVGGAALTGGSAEGTADFDFANTKVNELDKSVDVTDKFNGTTGTLASDVSPPTTLTYSRTVLVPQYDCVSYDNTATFTTKDTGATGSASKTVTVCGPAKTGALTMGFWQNKNGQDIITKGASTSGVCNSGTWLRHYAPFQDLSATATCAQVGTYVSNVVKAANASGASMNAMLKAQMLATALDVYFSDPALGGNKINAPAPIGGVSIDLTKVCTDLSCTAYEDSSSTFNGSPKTVSQMLSYAANQFGSTWYGNVKSTQELAKDAFDAINNQKAFAG